MPSLSVQRLTMAVFFLQPVAYGAWLPRIPDIQAGLGLGPALLAIALLGLPTGTLLTLAFVGPLVSRIGPRTALRVGLVLYGAALCLPPLAPDIVTLFFALMVLGAAMSFVELGLNVTADLAERTTSTWLMNTAHGFWALGIMAGSLLGAALAGFGLSVPLAVLLVAIVMVPLAFAAASALPAFADPGAQPGAGTTGKRSAWPPSRALLGICVFVFGITMTEGAMADWSAIFLRDALGAQGATVGLGYAVFALMVAAGRFGGDRLKRRFGAVGTARLCGLLALAGGIMLYLAPNIAMALMGFAVIGLGVSVGFPLAVTAAAGLGDKPAPANVAVLSFIALLGFLIGPPMIGFVAEHAGIRLGIACLVPILLLSLFFSARLAPRPAGPDPSSRNKAPGVS